MDCSPRTTVTTANNSTSIAIATTGKNLHHSQLFPYSLSLTSLLCNIPKISKASVMFHRSVSSLTPDQILRYSRWEQIERRVVLRWLFSWRLIGTNRDASSET
ncbi:hypothetical protein VNO80_05196 [Phaseolus coccineus]|uniref:Uncharacterized protein n=1 Tax=Phaseolus coccineus TaxID=3886 RepID=A0AAN9NFF2_PHACN